MTQRSRLWYIAQGNTLSSPLTETEVLQQLKLGEVSWVDFIHSPDEGRATGWQRICEIPGFLKHAPKEPAESLLNNINELTRPELLPEPKALPGKGRATWFLRVEKSEFGPLTLEEVRIVLKSGKLKGQVYGRKQGETTWSKVEKIWQLEEGMTGTSSRPAPSPGEKRRGPRTPLMATVKFTMAGDERVDTRWLTGACRDISAHGMLILSKIQPGYPGSSIRIQVTPNPESGIPPFQARGIVVANFEKETAFSIEFRGLTRETEKALAAYLKSRPPRLPRARI